ncbi:hypothetical protein FEM48_Zijuj07G0142800 [Ziziphus jujuba var. spinosa]|uniref:Uncharacterized protein n=1 Tax=Ziziphus jujuba var. spinosa TaxID=714518 RepID=A0A978V544_ZIZJJ|nr:hypothetical protein FEM48_Zijuj07G0142800 [Ziziphus jujuba var. spinosa]
MTKVILLRFGPTDFDDPLEALTRLHQTTSVAAYQEVFERHSHRADGLPEHFLVRCFIVGLQDDICLNVKIKNPHTLTETIDVACHRCEWPQLFMLEDTSDPTLEPELDDSLVSELQEMVPKILFHAIAEANHPQTIQSNKIHIVVSNKKRIECAGLCRDLTITIHGTPITADYYVLPMAAYPLVLGGYHCERPQLFMLEDTSDLTLEPELDTGDRTARVVSNKERIEYAGLCRDLTIAIQGTPITADYYVLPVAAYPLVFGVEWLATLSPIEINYSKLTMTFQQARVPCTFQGLCQGGIDVFTDKDFYQMQGPGFFLHLVAIKSSDTSRAQSA